MAILFSDDFNRSNRDLNGDNGWSQWGSGTISVEIVSNRVRQTGANPVAKQPHGARTEVAMEATIDRTGSAFETNLLLKSITATSDPADAWMMYIDNSQVKLCNGWSELSGSVVANTHTPGDRYRFALSETGGSTTLYGWKNGTLLTSVTVLGTIKNGTYAGIHAGSNGSTTNYFDDFIIDDTAMPGSGATAPTITSTALNAMYVGGSFSQQLVATGSPTPTWSTGMGSWPNGISMSSSGLVSGVPTQASSGSVTVTATNSEGNDLATFSWEVSELPYVHPNDANIIYDPGVWQLDGNVARAKDKNATLRMLLDASDATIQVTLPALTSPDSEWQSWGYSVNGVWKMFTYGPSSQLRTINESIDFGIAHKYWSRNVIEISYSPQFDSWAKGAFVFHGITVNDGGGTFPMSTRKRAGMVFGSSIVRGGASGGTLGDDSASDLFDGWTWGLRKLGDWELGVVGKGSQGMFVNGVGTSGDQVPSLTTAVGYLWDGVTRNFSNLDFVILLCRGAGESTPAAIGAGFQTIVQTIRAQAGSIPVLWLPHRTGDANVTADIAGAQWYAALDDDFHVVDDSTWPDLLATGGSPDTGHRYGWWDHSIYAPLVAGELSRILQQDGQGEEPTRVWNGTSWM